MLKKRILTIVAALAVMFTAGAVAAQPAAASYSQCPATGAYICLWSDTSYNGYVYVANVAGNVCYGLPAGWNDIAESAANNVSWGYLRVYTEGNCWGGSIKLDAWWSATTLWPINNAVSSFKVFPY